VLGVLDELVPGMWWQKAVLYGSLVAGALGVRALIPPGSVAGRWMAVTLWTWNAYVAERLQMGHWPVLVGLAVLPWLLHWSRLPSRPMLARYALVVPIGALSAGAGLVTGLVALAAGWGGRSAAARAALVALAAAGNAPWLVAGLVHGSAATSSSAGARAFATQAWGDLPVWLQVLDLGGIWNADAVLGSRTGWASTASVLFVVVCAVLGRSVLTRWLGRRLLVVVLASAVLGWAFAVLSGTAPGLLGWLAATVPGGGLLRDGSRFLALAAPAVVLAVAAGAERIVSLGPVRIARLGLATGLVLLPLALLPDLAAGASGRLRAVDYPPEYAEATRLLGEERARGVDGDVLLMPFSSYRAPSWNGGRKVIDPAGRHTSPGWVANDVLIVSGTEVPGEDPRAREVEEALGARSASERAERLRALGISHVLRSRGLDVDSISGPRAAEVPGEVLLEAPTLELVALEGTAPVQSWPGPGRARTVAVTAAWAAYATAPVLGLIALARRPQRLRRVRSGS
jgi:hypothetical protein